MVGRYRALGGYRAVSCGVPQDFDAAAGPGAVDDAPTDARGDLATRVKAGEVVVVPRLLQRIGWMDRILEICRDELVELLGAAGADAVMAARFQRLHEQVGVEDLFVLNRRLMARMRAVAPLLVRDFAHQIAGRRGTFAECYPNVRTIVPQDFAARHAAAFDAVDRARGAGKVTVHGPHYDSWHRHPLNTVNIWCAIGPVLDGNGMVVYPSVWGKRLPCDANGKIRRDQILGVAQNYPLEPGDALVFHANHLHGSELNRTDATRFVLSLRMTFERPAFPQAHYYRYVYSDWVGGRLDRWARLRVQLSYGFLRGRLRRMLRAASGAAEHRYVIGAAAYFAPTHDTAGDAPAPLAVAWDDARRACRLRADAVPASQIRALDARYGVARTAEGLVLFARKCPHAGADLLGGRLTTDGRLVCPWHNLAFSTVTGRSACRSIAPLQVIAGTRVGEEVHFEIPAPPPVSPS